MSDIRDILAGTIDERMTFTGENCVNLRTGTKFIAEYQESQNIELNEALGKDLRESGTIHVSDRAAAADLLNGTRITINLYGSDHQFEILQQRIDNPGSYQIEFGVMKITAKDR